MRSAELERNHPHPQKGKHESKTPARDPFLIPISFKNGKLEETTLFDAEKGGFPQTPIREKAKIHSGIHDVLSSIVIFI